MYQNKVATMDAGQFGGVHYLERAAQKLLGVYLRITHL